MDRAHKNPYWTNASGSKTGVVFEKDATYALDSQEKKNEVLRKVAGHWKIKEKRKTIKTLWTYHETTVAEKSENAIKFKPNKKKKSMENARKAPKWVY